MPIVLYEVVVVSFHSIIFHKVILQVFVLYRTTHNDSTLATSPCKTTDLMLLFKPK